MTESGSTTASLVNHFVDVTEVRALLFQKKIMIKELSDEPDPTPLKKGPVNADPKKDASKGVAKVNPADDEKQAADKLRSAKLFASGDDSRPTYIAKLTEIVKKWPNTVAGNEAKKLLDALK